MRATAQTIVALAAVITFASTESSSIAAMAHRAFPRLEPLYLDMPRDDAILAHHTTKSGVPTL